MVSNDLWSFHVILNLTLYSKHKSVEWLKKPLALFSLLQCHSNITISYSFDPSNTFRIILNNYLQIFGVSIVHLKCNVPFVSIYGSTWLIKLKLAPKMQSHCSAKRGFLSQLEQFKSKVQFLSQPVPSKSIVLPQAKKTGNIFFIVMTHIHRFLIKLIASSSPLAFASFLVLDKFQA